MTVNVPLLRKTLEHITEHPEEWNQAQWGVRNRCGTAYCLAGHALLLSDAQFQWATIDDGAQADIVILSNDAEPFDAGRHVLGLSVDDAETLFDPGNTLRSLYETARVLTDGEIPIPDVLPDGS